MAEVETSRHGAVVTITLNRPDVLNALNAAAHKALGAALKDARADDVRAVVITGAGRGFCVGQDLTEFRESAGDIGTRLRGNYHPNIKAIRALEKPVIAAVNGAAAGAGLSLACTCDLRIASGQATFVPAFVNIGLVPDSGGTFFVTRLMEQARAMTEQAHHPIRLVVTDDLQRNRLTVFFRLILAIPHLIWLALWTIVAMLAAIANWFATLVKGQSPEGLHNFLATYLRYQTQVYAYILLIADPFPGFGGKPGYPVEIEVDPPQSQNRWTVGFRIFLAIPAFII